MPAYPCRADGHRERYMPGDTPGQAAAAYANAILAESPDDPGLWPAAVLVGDRLVEVRAEIRFVAAEVSEFRPIRRPRRAFA